MPSPVKIAFERNITVLALDAILPLRAVAPSLSAWAIARTCQFG